MIWVLAVSLALTIAYWLIVVTEGSYLGTKVVEAMYDWGASHYDQAKQVLPQDDARHLARPLLLALQGKSSPLVLDVGVGTGRVPLALLRQWDFDGKIVGADLSRSMLAQAARKTEAQRERVLIVRSEAMHLPFTDSCFDAVTCLETLELLAQPSSALREIARVLSGRGRLLVSNRIGVDSFFFPRRAYRRRQIASTFDQFGLVDVVIRHWNTHYDLVWAQKVATASDLGMQPHMSPPAEPANRT